MKVALVIALAMVLLLFNVQCSFNSLIILMTLFLPRSKFGDGDDIIIRIEPFICRPKHGDPGKKGANPPTIRAEPSDHKVSL